MWLAFMLLVNVGFCVIGAILLVDTLQRAESGRYFSGHNALWSLIFHSDAFPSDAGTKTNATLSNLLVIAICFCNSLCVLALFRRMKWAFYALIGFGTLGLLCDFILGGKSLAQHALGFGGGIVFLLWFLDNAGYVKSWFKAGPRFRQTASKQLGGSGSEPQVERHDHL